MKTKLTKPFKPYVSLEQVMAFDTKKPETYTASPFLNAVLEAIEVVGFSNQGGVAKYLGVDKMILTHGIEIACGLNFTQLRELLLPIKRKKLQAAHPDMSTDQIAQALGFYNRTSLWRKDTKHMHHRTRREIYEESCRRAREIFEKLDREIEERVRKIEEEKRKNQYPKP